MFYSAKLSKLEGHLHLWHHTCVNHAMIQVCFENAASEMRNSDNRKMV